VDYPLGHPAGPPERPLIQRAIVSSALDALTAVEHSGTLIDLGLRWPAGDEWKRETDEDDARKPRNSEPQYQFEQDRVAAEALHAAGRCSACIGLDV
jgi:hypothetical protein